jgi:plastocyanin
MEKFRAAAIALVVSAVAVVPLAAASAAAKPHARFEVSKLAIVGHTRTYDVADKDAVVKARIQVKDHDKKFDPASVTLTVTEKISGLPAGSTTFKARLAGHSKVVSNWHATITVAKGSVAPGTTATYCIALVKVADGTAVTPVRVSAKGLVGRDCFNVTNTATP